MLAALVVPALWGAPLQKPPMDLYAMGPYETGVPRPEATLGYEIGSRITTYRDQERTLFAIADRAGARVRSFEYGRSVEGRPLRVFAISSPENIKRLESIRQDMAKIAAGEATPELMQRTPVIVWINECIHGNEPASFESAMPLVYNLAASKHARISKLLQNAVVIINPVFNPDGHERFAVWYGSVARGSAFPRAYEQSEPGVIHGRSNHYRFDMNRDRISFSQDETRQETAEFRRWNPQVYVDQHGQVETYFFPPNPMSVNANTDRERLNKWTDVFGRATAKAFDSKGFLYYIKDQFDFYYPGYTDTYTALTGAIGMTHETDGGKVLAKERNDGTVVTLRMGIEKHFTSAIAVAESAAENRAELLASYRSFKQKWISGEAAGKFRRVVVTDNDPRPLKRLREQLTLAGIRSTFAKKSFTQPDAHDYWSAGTGAQTFPAGSLVIDIAQPNGALAKALLEADSNFEPEFLKAQLEKKKTAPEGETYPGPEGSEFYDLTAWSLVYAHGLKAWWCESAVAIEADEAGSRVAEAGTSPIGYALPYRDQDDALAAIHILNSGVNGLSTPRNLKVGDITLPAGSFLFLDERNEGDWAKVVRDVARTHGSRLIAIPTSYPREERYGPGSGNLRALRAPKIGVIFGRDANLTQSGATWYLFERVFKLPFTALSESALSGNLSAFTTIIAPDGTRGTTSGKLREWVQEGGNLVVLEGTSWTVGSSAFVDLKRVDGDIESLPGSIFRASFDSRSALTYGYPAGSPLAVPIWGSDFFRKRSEGGSIVTLDPDPKVTKLLSGWTYGEPTEKALADTVWLQDVPLGDGHVVIFTIDPTSRAMWPGLNKLFLNAILFGG